MSTLKVTNVAHETSTLNTLVFDNGGGSGNGRVTTKGTIGEITAVSYASTITLDFRTGNNFTTTLTGNTTFANPSNISAGQSGVIFVVVRAIQATTSTWFAPVDNVGAVPSEKSQYDPNAAVLLPVPS